MSINALNDTPTPLEVTSATATSATKSGSDCNSKAFHAKNEVFIGPNIHQEIKNEPPIDISDVQAIGAMMTTEECLEDKHGKIRLTPTINLLATPTPVNPKRKFVCPYENCTKSYGKSSHLRSHLTWHTGIKPFVCQVADCGKGFTRSDELNRHFRTHTGEKPFECIQCSKKFSRSDHLTKHLATHAKQMMNSSKKPRSQPGSSSNKRVPREVDQQIQYNDGMHFMAALVGNCDQSKVEQNHDNNESPLSHITKESTAFHFPIKIKLERPDKTEDYHVVTPPPPEAAVKQIAPSDSEDEIPSEIIVPTSTLICPPFSPKVRMSDSSITPEANTEPLSTDVAVTRLPQLGKITAEVTYDPERPFRCNQCSKSFKRHDDLNRHLRTHTGEKPFACGECERRFMRGDHLKKHLKTHTKLR